MNDILHDLRAIAKAMGKLKEALDRLYDHLSDGGGQGYVKYPYRQDKDVKKRHYG